MLEQSPIPLDFSRKEEVLKIFPCPPVWSSHQAGWKNIFLEHYRIPAWEIPEVSSPQHALIICDPLEVTEAEMFLDGRYFFSQVSKQDLNNIGLLPAHLPVRTRWLRETAFTQCYLEPTFLHQVAHESINPDYVELMLTTPPTRDPLIWQIGSALKELLASGDTNSCFYAESMATALAAHLLKYYASHKYVLREYKDGLPKLKLKKAIEYINDHLSEDISLETIASHIEMSQYHFCRLFKQSIGISPHAYLVERRIERAKKLLKQNQASILSIAIDCGFANSSSFSKRFKQITGISPQQFRGMQQ